MKYKIFLFNEFFTKESKALLKGEYGALPGEVNDEIRHKTIGTDKVISCRPADPILLEMKMIKEEFGVFCKAENDVLSCALFPQVAPEFIKKRDKAGIHEIIVEWDGE